MGAENPIRRTTTARSIAQRMGIAERTVRKIIAEPRDQYLARAAHRRERILELRQAGWTLAAIATELDMTVGGVNVTLHRLRQAGANVPPRSNRGRKPKTIPAPETHNNESKDHETDPQKNCPTPPGGQ